MYPTARNVYGRDQLAKFAEKIRVSKAAQAACAIRA